MDPGLALDGELTIYRAAELRTLLLQHLADGTRRIDLSGVTEIDSAGFQLLVAARRSAEAAGVALALVAPSAAVRDLAATLGLPENWTAGDADAVPEGRNAPDGH
jgi:anti-anti-sigma factor